MDTSKKASNIWLTASTKISLGIVLALPLISFSQDYESPQEMKWVVLSLVLACLSLLCCKAVLRVGYLSVDGLDAIGFGFVLWGLLSLLRTADILTGMDVLVQLFLGFVVFMLAKAYGAKEIGALSWAITASMGIVTFIAFWSRSSWGGFWNENYIIEFILMALPFVIYVALKNKRGWLVALPCLIMGISLIYMGWFNSSRMEYFVLLAGSFSGAAYLIWRRSPIWSFLFVAAVIILSALGVWAIWDKVSTITRESLEVRLPLWVDSIVMWADKPWLGHGMGSYAALLPLYKERHIEWLGNMHSNWLTAYNVTIAAHNEYLQFLVEYGLVGCVFPLAAIWLTARAVRRVGGFGEVGRLGAAVVFIGLFIAFLEFPLDNPATVVLFALGTGLLAGAVREGLPTVVLALDRGIEKAGIVLMAVGFAFSSTAYAWRYDAAWRAFGQAYQLQDYDPAKSFWNILDACQLWPGSFRFRIDLYLMLMNWSRSIGEQPLSPEETDRVFDITLTAGFQHAAIVERLRYLLGTGFYSDKKEETERWLVFATEHYSRDIDVWFAQAMYYYYTKKYGLARDALARARTLLVDGDENKLQAEQLGIMINQAEQQSSAR